MARLIGVLEDKAIGEYVPCEGPILLRGVCWEESLRARAVAELTVESMSLRLSAYVAKSARAPEMAAQLVTHMECVVFML